MRTAQLILGIVIGTAGAAHAQDFPPDDQWDPLQCGAGVMSDAFRDESGAIDERDIVGTGDDPAGFRADDADYFYLRMRLDEDVAPGGSLHPFSWGWEIDLDDDLTTYEILILVDGQGGGAGEVVLFENTTVTLPNDPNDPADQPAIASYAFADNGRTVVASAVGPAFGAGPDSFLDVAVPWVDLEPLGLTTSTPIYVWAASSSSSQSLNADFACHNGAVGEPTLDGIADPGAIDPDTDTDGDGFTDADEIDVGTDPNDPNDFPGAGDEGRLEGGGGCSAAGAPHGPVALLVLVVLVGLMRRGSISLTTSRARRAGVPGGPRSARRARRRSRARFVR